MALVDFFETLTVMNRIASQDEYGDIVFVWQDGASFQGSFDVKSSAQFLAAGKYGNQATIQIDCPTTVNLPQGTYIRREKDGNICKTVSLPNDYNAPDKADEAMNMRYYVAERAVLD